MDARPSSPRRGPLAACPAQRVDFAPVAGQLLEFADDMVGSVAPVWTVQLECGCCWRSLYKVEWRQ